MTREIFGRAGPRETISPISPSLLDLPEKKSNDRYTSRDGEISEIESRIPDRTNSTAHAPGARPPDRRRLLELRDLDRLVREPGRQRPAPGPVPLMVLARRCEAVK